MSTGKGVRLGFPKFLRESLTSYSLDAAPSPLHLSPGRDHEVISPTAVHRLPLAPSTRLGTAYVNNIDKNAPWTLHTEELF